MTEKQFTIEYDKDGDLIVKETIIYYMGDFVDKERIKPLINRMNELAKEKRQVWNEIDEWE